MPQIRFRPGLRPGPRWGSSRRSPRPPSRLGKAVPPTHSPPPRRLRHLDLGAFAPRHECHFLKVGNPRPHRRRFVPDCENFKIATKSQFILTILVYPSSSWKQIGNENLSGRISACRNFLPILQSVPI